MVHSIKSSIRCIPGSWSQPNQHFHKAITSEWYQVLFTVMNTFYYASSDFYRKKGLAPGLLPITCDSVSSPMGLGSDSLPVKINLFDSPTYLADSMQFQLEYMLRLHKKGIWYIMPTFREEDPGARHLNQFFHSEAEIPGKLEDIINFVEEYLLSITSAIWSENGDKLEKIIDDTSHVKKLANASVGSIPRVAYTEALKILGDNTKFYDYKDGVPKIINSLGEKHLMKHFGGILWLTHFPEIQVPFYQAVSHCGQFAMCADLLMGIGEVAGCGERHFSHESVKSSLNRHGVLVEDYEWYIEMKKHYPIQTSGFGMGIERYLLWLTNHDDIRDIHHLPRLKGLVSKP